MRAHGNGSQGHYFGFHDKPPFSPDDRLLACQRVLVVLRMPLPTDEVEVGIFGGHDWTSYRALARTHAWNWQQARSSCVDCCSCSRA